MSDRSRIEWTEATWNPVTGCTKVSPGCAHCYAEAIAARFGRSFDVILHPERLDQPLRWRRPRRVFVNSMSDLFHEQVPEGFIDQAFAVMGIADRHTFQVLTKRPRRMKSWACASWGDGYFEPHHDRGDRVASEATHWMGMPPDQWPLSNVWLGVSVENQRWAERVDTLLQTPAAVRFVSAEPLLGPLDLNLEFGYCPKHDFSGGSCLQRHHPGVRHLDWLIVGGESGPNARPMRIEWLESLVDQADEAGIPVFVKQDSGPRPGRQGRIPDRLWARKEMPR